MFCNLSVSCGIDQEKSFSITVVSIFCKNEQKICTALKTRTLHFTTMPEAFVGYGKIHLSGSSTAAVGGMW